MGSLQTCRCYSLLFLTVSQILLVVTTAADYSKKPKPRINIEEGTEWLFKRGLQHTPEGREGAPALTAPGDGSQQVYAILEKNFNAGSLGQAISASPGNPLQSPPSSAAEVPERQNNTSSDRVDAAKTEKVSDSETKPENEHRSEDDVLQPPAADQDVSRLGVFFSPRPALSDPALYDRPLCQNPDGTQGVCHASQLSCRLRGGIFSHKCSGDNGVCCVFQHSCSAFTNERVSYYRNPDFPSKNSGNLICNYKVKIQPKVCGVRVDLLNYTTPITAKCSKTQLSFFVGSHTRTVPVCGVLTGRAMIFDGLDASEDKEMVISHTLGGKEPYAFNMRVTQILCSAIRPFEEESACGRHNIGMVRHKREARVTPDSADFDANNYQEARYELEADLPTAEEQLTTRIVGGREAKVNEWPWQVALVKKLPSKKGTRVRFFCGGTLISRNQVLTAAHCVTASTFHGLNHTDPRDHLLVILGEHDLRTLNESKQLLKRVESISIHPLYDPSVNQNDIALLQLTTPVNYTGGISPACLPKEKRNLTDKDINVSGWGVVSFNGTRRGPTSFVLKTTGVKGVSREQCEAKWKTFDSPSTIFREVDPINERQGCIGSTPGAACFGDSGGPITFKEDSGRFTVVGAVSFGPPICKVGGEFPTIYSRVSAFLDWIRLATLEIF